VPRLELRPEQVRAEALRPGEDAEELDQERPHQRADDGGGAVLRDRREEQAERGEYLELRVEDFAREWS
jgi:hypothetical protein